MAVNVKLLYLCLGVLVALAFVASISRVTSPISGSDFHEKIPGLPFHPRVVDVDSKGNIFVLSLDQDVWRSVDNGVSWELILNDNKSWAGVSPAVTRNWLTLFVDTHDAVFANILTSSWNLYRSLDAGRTWTIVLANTRRSWHMDESSNGTLWFHTYTGPGWAAIYKSVDRGATWTVFANLTMIIEDLRVVSVDDYDDNSVWVATSRRVMYWNQSSWVTVHFDNMSQSYISSIWFDREHTYLGAEYLGGRTANWRYSHAPQPTRFTDWTAYDYYWDAGDLGLVTDEHSFNGLRVGGMMLFGIRSQLWGSWDGTRWVKIVELGNSTASDIASISQRQPLYFVDKKKGELYRLSIGLEDLVHLYYSEFLKYRGSLADQENYVAEYRIVNGTNQVDLTNVALSNAEVSVKGLSRKNHLNNSGFEDGTLGQWVVVGAGSDSVVSEVTHSGAYSLKIVKSAADATDKYVYQNYAGASSGSILVFSAWVRSNITLVNQARLAIRNETSNLYIKARYFNVSTTWSRIRLYQVIQSASAHLFVELHAVKGVSYELFVDDLQLESREVEIASQDLQARSIEHLQYQPATYFGSILDTSYPNLTLAGQTVSHSGFLSNGTESNPADVPSILTGVVQVDARIGGSGQAILRLTGFRILSLTNSVLKARSNDGIFIGRYFSAPTITTNITDFIALTNKEAEIVNQTYALKTLSLTIGSPPGTISTTLIYVGDRGEPTSGTTSWTYDSASRIVAISLSHTSPQQTLFVYWAEHSPPVTAISLGGVQGSNGWFTSDILVTLTATDDLSGVNRTEYSYDSTAWIVYAGPFYVSVEGNTAIYYRSVDNDGNRETTRTEAIKMDKTSPVGSILINNGATYATSAEVTLTLTASHSASGVSDLRFSNDGIWDTESWQAPTLTKIWTLPNEDGARTVYYQIRNEAGLVSDTYSDTIVLDTAPPKGTISINNGAKYTNTIEVTLTLSATDTTSGVTEMRLSNDNTTFTDWQPYSSSLQWRLQEGDGSKTVYTQFADRAELVSLVCSAAVVLDFTAPKGLISINEGAAYTDSSSVTLTLSAEDSTSGIAMMRLSNDNQTWTPWESYSTMKAWSLPMLDGFKTVYVEFMDKAGLVSSAYQHTIELDATVPVANAGNDQTVNQGTTVVFDASGSTDENGIPTYIWTFVDMAQQMLSGKSPTYTFATPGTYAVMLTVEDVAGNTATDSVIITVLKAPENNALPLWVVAAAIAAIGIIVLAAFLKTRRNKIRQ